MKAFHSIVFFTSADGLSVDSLYSKIIIRIKIPVGGGGIKERGRRLECDHSILSTFGCSTLVCFNLSRAYAAVKILPLVGIATEGLWFIFT